MSFVKIFDLTAGVFSFFYNIYVDVFWFCFFRTFFLQGCVVLIFSDTPVLGGCGTITTTTTTAE